ncbi:Corticotropin-releasing factor receptor 1 [Aphelenchoides bicaudatus]|nr:Corticotropin-releasing factor receptor 1 [Aphelenchoides bicaudatus]
MHSDPCTSSDCSPLNSRSASDEMAIAAEQEQQSINQQTIMIWVCVVGYVISTLLCLGSLYVFKHFKKLWCLRNGIHANFIGCIAMHNICWLILAACITVGLEICLLTEALVEITKFCVTSTFCWMLVEGAYLYLSILYCLHVHRIKYWICAAVGWGLPFALSMQSLWSRMFLRSGKPSTGGCLDIDESLDNLTVTVIIVIIFTNIVILLAVIYVLFTKFRQISDKEWTTLRHVFRALLFLCPLLGINYAFTIYHPENPAWLSTGIAFYSLFSNAFQGTFISIFFCFNTEEVRACLQRSARMSQTSISTTKVHEMHHRRSIEESQLTFLGP